MHIGQVGLADICGEPAPGLRHRRYRPKLEQAFGVDPVKADIQRCRPAFGFGFQPACQEHAVPVGIDQRQLPDVQPQGVKPQPQVKRAHGKADRLLEQALGIDDHLGKADLGQKVVGHIARLQRPAACIHQVAVPRGAEAKRLALDVKVGQQKAGTGLVIA